MASRQTPEPSEKGKPLPTPHTRASQRVIDAAAERQRLMDLFGTYGNTRVAAATSSSSSQHNVELESPSPPTSANASTSSSGQLPENIHLSMPAMPRSSDTPQPPKPRMYSKSADRSRTNIAQASANIAEKKVPAEAGSALNEQRGLNERQRRKIARAYNNQFAHLLGNAQSADSGISPAVSVMTGSSFNSPRTITLEEMRQASRPEVMSSDSLNRPARGKWSQGTTPSPVQDRDSGLFGNQVFAPSPATRFEPIQEEAGESPLPSSSISNVKPKYDVHVPRPETLARTQTLGTRSPTPTERPSSAAGMAPKSTRRRRATTTTPDDKDSSQRLYKEHARSRSFGSESTEQITLQQLRQQQQQQAMLPLIPPPPPANARQFQSPFLDQQHVESDRESATHTRIRRQRRQASSVMSAGSPSYTLSSAYSPSNAGSDLAYELTFLGVHPTVESPYTHSIMSRNSNSRPTLPVHSNTSRIMSDSSNRRRSSSVAGDDMAEEELRAARRQMGHMRSESAGSRVSNIRSEFEQLATTGNNSSSGSSNDGSSRPASRAMSGGQARQSAAVGQQLSATPKSKKVAQIRERIEEWQRGDQSSPSSWASSDIRHHRLTTGSGTGSSVTASGAQQQIGEIEAIGEPTRGASTSRPRQEPSSSPRLVPLTPEIHQHRQRDNKPVQRSDSKHTVQSSNVEPSLFGSDRSAFSTPLLAPLPPVSVPSDTASLRTEPPHRVQQAVSSPVSIGGRKKQSLVIDAQAAADIVLQDAQHVKSASPVMLSSGSSSPLTSPPVPHSAATSAAQRRAWAQADPQRRPPLALHSADSSSSSANADDAAVWEERLRKRAEQVPLKPAILSSPANAVQSKSYGGLHERDLTQRKEHVQGALASLERQPSPRPRKQRHNRDPVRSPNASTVTSPQSSSSSAAFEIPSSVASLPPQHEVSDHEAATSEPDNRIFEDDNGDMHASPGLSSRPQFRMGRHGSSPLNPYTASGSTAPPMPSAEQPPGLIKRLTSTRQRRRHSKDPQQTVGPTRQTPLPRRWWRNIKESMYAPIPPMHIDPRHGYPHLQYPSSVETGDSDVDALPARPQRRHSIGGSTDIEQHKMTQALSPRENMRRKLSLAERVRGMLRGNNRRMPMQINQYEQPYAGVPAAADGYSLKLAQSISNHPQEGQGSWSASNPFGTGMSDKHPRRRASFDTLSVHEMAEVDRAEMDNRLNRLLSPHTSGNHSQTQQQHKENLAESPALGKSVHSAASPSKFSFQAPSPEKPKPLPQTPKRPSAEQIFTFPSQQEIQQQQAPSPLFKVADDRKGKSPKLHQASPLSQMLPPEAKGSGTLPEMTQRPSSSRVKPLPEKPPIAATPQNIQVNTAEIPSAPSSDIPVVAPGPPVRKRPSLLKRLTQGWRSNPPLQPISEEEPYAYHQQQGDPSHGAISAAAAGAAATGILGRLFGSMRASGAPKNSAEPQAQQQQPQMQQQQPQIQQMQSSVPNVTVVHSPPPSTPDSYSVDLHGAGPQPYPLQAASAAHLSAMPMQQHISSGSLHPHAGPHGPLPAALTPHNQSQAMQFGSMYPGGTQTPLPGQQSQLNIQSQNFRPDAAGFASLPQQQHLGGPMQTLPMSVPLHQGRPHGIPPNAPPTSQYPGVNPYGQPPSTLHGADPAAGTTSKLMSAMASIPLIGSLFGKKQKPEAAATPPTAHNQMPPPGQYHGQYGGPPSTYYTRPTSGMSGYTSYTSHAYPPSASPIGPQNILEKVKNAGKWYFIPMFSFLLRESVIREIRPLVGRYAMRYPLVEAEERAAISKIAQAKKGIVHAGGMRAVDAKEFRHAAPALRYNTLDQRLDNIFVPRFSRLRKYRRAPEVWDDPEAHEIYQRVQSRLQAGNNTHPGMFNRGRNPGEPVLRGGGGRNPRETLGNHEDFNCSSRGLSEIGESAAAAGSGVHLVAEPAYSGNKHPTSSLPLAYRLGDFVTKLFSKRHEPPLRAQSTASYLDHSAENSRRQTSLISPRSRGMSRIEEDDKASEHVQVDVREEATKSDNESEEELRSLKRGPSVRGNQETEEQRPPNRFMRWFFGRGPTDAPEQHRASEPGALPDRFYANTTGLSDAGILNAALRRSKPDIDERNDEPEPEAPARPVAKADKATQAEPSASSSSNNPPMFPPFSHLPPRLVDQLLHRVGEPRVFIGSAKSQLVPPTNSAEAGDEIFGDTSPYRTGTEWNFVESVKFSSPYPTSQKAVRNRKLWSKQQRKRRLLLKPRNNEISRWPLHLEIMRDFMQMLALVLGTCGFTKARLDSSVGDRWPWIVVAGIPEALGLLWADLSTTTGKSIGFFIFFGALAAIALAMWMYGLYLEDPSRPKKQSKEEEAEQEKSEASEKDALITYEEELVPVPGPLDFIGRLFSKVTRRQRMHAVYVVLSTLYVPVIKLCLEAIVWGQGYWPVPNPYRTEDSPQFDSLDTESGMRDPGSFCYTTTMHTGRFNGAFVVLPLASLLFIVLGLIVPWQIHRLAEHHKPRIPGWADGKVPGYKLPPKEQVSMSNLPGSGVLNSNGEPRPAATAPTSGSAAPPPGGTSVPREVTGKTTTRNVAATRDGTTTRDDPNPMLYAEPIWQGIQQLNLINPEMLGYLATIYGMMYGANGMGGAGGHPDLSNLGGLFSNAWKHIQQWWSKETEEDPYMGMEKDEAYQARLRDMKHSHRNRHLATVQYRRALDTDTCDMRFLYGGQYPAHAGDPARMLLWKLLAVVLAVTLSKDNCWSRGHPRQSLDIGRCTMLLLVALLMLRSLHAHRPFFDPTANLSGLLGRLGVCCAAIFAFPLFLLSDPLSQAHMGLCVTLAVLNLLVVLGMVMLLWSALPGVQMAVQGSSAPLTLSPGILVATNPYDPRLRRLLIERVWQDTWSAILLGSRDFRLLPGHRIAFCKTNVHPPYMVNYIGFAAERHLENLYLYSSIGRRAYCQAILLERNSDQRTGLMDEIVRVFTGPDMYFNPFASDQPVDSVAARFRLAQSEIKSWFGKVYILHFPFMVCIIYDDLPNVIVPIIEENDLQLYLQQNQDPIIVAKRDTRRRLRALHGQHITLTFIEHSGPDGSHLRYCLPQYADENEQYLAQFAGRRRLLYRGIVTVHQHGEQLFSGANVTPGFACAVELLDELPVEDEHLVNNLDRASNPFRREFWQHGRVSGFVRSAVSQRSRATLQLNEHNRHLLGVTDDFEETSELRALFDENSDVIDQRLPIIENALEQYARECHAGFIRKRTGLTPSFHIDVFAPGPESYHVQNMVAQGQNPPHPATPALFGNGPTLNGQWQNDEHGRLSFIPTMEQLAERLERLEENRYVRDLMVDHRDDIVLLYERLRTLVPSESNDPVKFAWYIFWDDLYRRYAQQVRQFKEHDTDFNPLYPQSLPYYPLPRHRLEVFLYRRKLFKPLRAHRNSQAVGGSVGGALARLPLIGRLFGARMHGHQMDEEYALDPMPVPNYVPGIDTNGAAGIGDAHVWRVGDHFDGMVVDDGDNAVPFEPGCPATGFIHSGLLNRLYAWLDIIAYGTDR
ncbi:hypothetical protein IWW36_001806 [Coemansia brasiliensis]|uniref:Uncharacterized protein n=1 Tax=Coemansia brasiliensis TaxID=2650707 RepID=A0A9W8IG15_9FUNG|nr:hypothetical protein IWW36_001806 [Coemansia brasiliensis]